MKKFLFIMVVLFSTTCTGPLSYGVCKTSCNIIAVGCFTAAAGVTVGAIPNISGIPTSFEYCGVMRSKCFVNCENDKFPTSHHLFTLCLYTIVLRVRRAPKLLRHVIGVCCVNLYDEMDIKNNILSFVYMTLTYVYLIKPRVPATGSDSGKLMMLNLCARSRYIIPVIVTTSLWLLRANFQWEAFFHITNGQNVRPYFRYVRPLSPQTRPMIHPNDTDYDDNSVIYDYRTDDDGDTYTSDSYSDQSSVSIIDFPI